MNEISNEMNKDRNLLVFKHNDLIQKAKYNLTALEQKLITLFQKLNRQTKI